MAKAMRRRVLLRDDCGLCVLLPKTAWQDAPAPGRSFTAVVDGRRRRVTVFSEPCDCRGTGVHEHRFLVLPGSAGVEPGSRCTVSLG
jgi:hypothetical protein